MGEIGAFPTIKEKLTNATHVLWWWEKQISFCKAICKNVSSRRTLILETAKQMNFPFASCGDVYFSSTGKPFHQS